jgi:hypothetical protein
LLRLDSVKLLNKEVRMAKGQGNFGNPEQHRKAGKLGAKAQPIEAKAKGGRNSRRGRASS